MRFAPIINNLSFNRITKDFTFFKAKVKFSHSLGTNYTLQYPNIKLFKL